MTPEQELIAAVIGALQLGRPLPEAVHAILTTPSVQAALAKVRGGIDAKRIKNAADGILAPLAAEVGRYLYDMLDADMVQIMHNYGVKITAAAFKELYDATDFDSATPKPEPVLRWEGNKLWLGQAEVAEVWKPLKPYWKWAVIGSQFGQAPTHTEARTAAEQAVRDWLKRAGCV